MESAISFEMAKQLLLSLAVILAAGAVSGFLSQKFKLPDVPVYVMAGIILGIISEALYGKAPNLIILAAATIAASLLVLVLLMRMRTVRKQIQ